MGRLAAYLRRHREWSRRIFGDGLRTEGICAHIAKELDEIHQSPTDLREWIDVIILAMDGYWRAGGEPEALLQLLEEKQEVNFRRKWPPITAEDVPMEHIKEDE